MRSIVRVTTTSKDWKPFQELLCYVRLTYERNFSCHYVQQPNPYIQTTLSLFDLQVLPACLLTPSLRFLTVVHILCRRPPPNPLSL
jgi:hypothetical protein